jgi:hypothetical protein
VFAFILENLENQFFIKTYNLKPGRGFEPRDLVLQAYAMTTSEQGCQMVCFQTKNPNLGKFLGVLQWKMMVIFYGHLVHFTVFCYILWTFDIVRGNLVYFPSFWYFELRKIWQPCSSERMQG